MTIAPVPGSPMAPKRRGSPPAALGAGMTSGPAVLLAAAWLPAMPRSAMLTVAQPSSTAAAVAAASRVTAGRVDLMRLAARSCLAAGAGVPAGAGWPGGRPGQGDVAASGALTGRFPARRSASVRQDPVRAGLN